MTDLKVQIYRRKWKYHLKVLGMPPLNKKVYLRLFRIPANYRMFDSAVDRRSDVTILFNEDGTQDVSQSSPVYQWIKHSLYQGYEFWVSDK